MFRCSPVSLLAVLFLHITASLCGSHTDVPPSTQKEDHTCVSIENAAKKLQNALSDIEILVLKAEALSADLEAAIRVARELQQQTERPALSKSLQSLQSKTLSLGSALQVARRGNWIFIIWLLTLELQHYLELFIRPETCRLVMQAYQIM